MGEERVSVPACSAARERQPGWVFLFEWERPGWWMSRGEAVNWVVSVKIEDRRRLEAKEWSG